MQELSWSQDQDDFRVVFIAGNESFNQGSILWSDAIERAIESDVLVNTIYCGSAESKERELWASGASLAQESHFNINQNKAIVVIESPYDEEIARMVKGVCGRG